MTLAKIAKTAKEDKEINMENGMVENAIGKAIVDVAIQIQRELGPGLLESVYETILVYELRNRGLQAERWVSIPYDIEMFSAWRSLRECLLLSVLRRGQSRS